MIPNLNDIIRVVAVFSRGAGLDIYTNTFHFKVLAAGWAAGLNFMQEIAQYLDDSYFGINTQVAANINYDHIDGQNLTQDVLYPLVPWPSLVTGNNASDMLPLQVTARPYFPTTRPKTRAAICLPPYGEDTTTGGGVLDATAIGVTETWADRFVGNIILPGGTVSYGAYNPEFTRFTPVDSRVLPDRLRTLRRRRAGVGS